MIGVNIDGIRLSGLTLKSDVVLFSENGIEMGKMINEFNRESVKLDLRINIGKKK